MLLIQIFLVIIIGLIIVRLFSRLKKEEISVLNFLIWLFFWSAALIIIFFPDFSNVLARILGVGRGADLVIYSSLILIFYFIFSHEVRMRKTDQKIEKIVRYLSLEEKKSQK
ncbi:DUF2304 domain-containing protein [bacterium (Candidatus Moisslbacteria) CG12_big_fil_rev_8_21_14_0_65_36_11]|nr:DUF2304 domain-containing protein [Candidatus Kuenenbacteria bacterium]OIP76218.1 MAG: hypothetical protein AUK09_02575 [Parcubacteria group bacterium CG2_30_36_38]PIV46228.1 MAG: DUF2304 domain-containing protein [bacterium (Candidatus Moisslbacteria) CG02_land_8_20_14_3_00_36_53]PIW67944.1 MAG: DUF2304 domain-containing protein [bacterium (Candidatus Moisslbacteria) CG12_big_fil_rev_8_21_14_0_65_36_11]PIZ90246.1 MAG: DUF2304 domain-containing protein [bacterium (Candidatus Moisslbacteria) 